MSNSIMTPCCADLIQADLSVQKTTILNIVAIANRSNLVTLVTFYGVQDSRHFDIVSDTMLSTVGVWLLLYIHYIYLTLIHVGGCNAIFDHRSPFKPMSNKKFSLMCFTISWKLYYTILLVTIFGVVPSKPKQPLAKRVKFYLDKSNKLMVRHQIIRPRFYMFLCCTELRPWSILLNLNPLIQSN